MAAFSSIEVSDVPLSRPSVVVGVFRYNPKSIPKYEFLPNVRVLHIAYREGADPGYARFKYVFNPADPATDPVRFEQALSTDTLLENVVQNDERLVVLKENLDGTASPIFDGFAQVPELSLTPSQELVSFVAHGVAVREWDAPIRGCTMRDCDNMTTGLDHDVEFDIAFNAGGEPNASPVGSDTEDGQLPAYPVFVDTLVKRDVDQRRYWTLPMAVRYLLYRHNAEQSYVQNPSEYEIDAILDSRIPKAGVTMDPSDETTYDSRPIVVSEYNPCGKPWPNALSDLLGANGFGMVFRLESDESGDPATRLEIFRRQDGAAGTFKPLYLQPYGEQLDPARSNIAIARLARDTSRVANAYRIEGGPVRYEASFILAPAFPIAIGDSATAAALRVFDRNDPSFAKVARDKYRLFVFDETGEGHWDFATSSLVHSATSLSDLFDTVDKAAEWVKRRRVPAGELLSLDANGKPLKARLAISTDYSGATPGLWDGTGTWQSIAGGYDLLKDRLGIWINAPNPNGWTIGMPTVSGLPYPSGVVRVVEELTNVLGPKFRLRLTCVIESDQVVKGQAGRRPSSTSAYTIERRIKARERFRKSIIAQHSEFNAGDTSVIVVDDTGSANDEAAALRVATESGEVAGNVVIPRFSNAYQIGDRVSSIRGRDLSLRTNAGSPLEEGPVFPSIVGLSWEFEQAQRTVLQLSDRRGEQS